MASSPSKSVFDGIPIIDKATQVIREVAGRLSTSASGVLASGVESLGIVSCCPICGAPIYGREAIDVGDSPSVKHSCGCHSDQVKNFSDTVSSK